MASPRHQPVVGALERHARAHLVAQVQHGAARREGLRRLQCPDHRFRLVARHQRGGPCFVSGGPAVAGAVPKQRQDLRRRRRELDLVGHVLRERGAHRWELVRLEHAQPEQLRGRLRRQPVVGIEDAGQQLGEGGNVAAVHQACSMSKVKLSWPPCPARRRNSCLRRSASLTAGAGRGPKPCFGGNSPCQLLPMQCRMTSSG
ncbi:Uncharacterised protein [Bordetella pertussis]|nr:Uncharacterised protein [Bordetella pertussis]